MKEVDYKAIWFRGFVFFHLFDVYLHFLKYGGSHEHGVLITRNQRGNVISDFLYGEPPILFILSKEILIERNQCIFHIFVGFQLGSFIVFEVGDAVMHAMLDSVSVEERGISLPFLKPFDSRFLLLEDHFLFGSFLNI